METKESKLIKGFKVLFKEDTHQYFNDKGQELTSVSKVISQYKQPFDPHGNIIVKCAEKRGVTVEELRKEWDDIRDNANIKGHSFHGDFESYVKTKMVPETVNKVYINQILQMGFSGELFSEVTVANDYYKIAGTTDLVELIGKKKINIYDFKTNKKLDKKNHFLPKYMKFPLLHLENCNFVHYTIQLSLYAWMFEELGFWVNNLNIFYINPRTNLVEKHPITFIRKDILKLLERYELDKGFDF